MADELKLQNYSDDSKIKRWIQEKLAPRVFKDIPLTQLNTGSLSLITEYMSQGIEQLAFTSSFYFNESFITKAILADSIYSEAAIFNIGYSYAIPSSCNFLLELKIEDIHNNAVLNSDNGLYEFILDKDTKFNLSNGSVYSLDYDILIQYKNVETTTLENEVQAWNIQYINKEELNSVAKNKDTYIVYRVTDTWLCLFVQASEYERQTHTVVNNMANGIPNQDTIISCQNHICGFDIKYIDGEGNEQWIPHDHILPIHDSVKDNDPYVHYIMDNPQTIRFMWQLNGSKYFVPKINSSYEIVVYTCHGEAANFSAFNNEEQPQVITASNKYSNNGNVMKAAFVISGSLGGTNIGNIETVRRETIEAYNTANIISTDHDIEEYFKTFYFKNILYPFFYKRRDDPWGRIWSGYIALKDDDDYIFRTNTLHGKIPYEVLYNNNDNTINSNEIIIPPAWVWVYNGENKHTVTPYTAEGSTRVEKANTVADIGAKFIFANPFGIRIQKEPFAIGYFNPWINDFVTCTMVPKSQITNPMDVFNNDASAVYHATPIVMNVRRTYQENYYKLTTYISPTITQWIDGTPLVKNLQANVIPPIFPAQMWKYFKKPLDSLSPDIPMLPLNQHSEQSLLFDPEKTYFCVKNKTREDDRWLLNGVFWVLDRSNEEELEVQLPITTTSGQLEGYYGDDAIWGDGENKKWEPVYATGDTTIDIYNNHQITPTPWESHITFNRVNSQNYYEMRLDDSAPRGQIQYIRVQKATKSTLTKYGEDSLYQIGDSMKNTHVNIQFMGEDNFTTYTIKNAASVYIPWSGTVEEVEENNVHYYQFDFNNVGSNGIILYADMKPIPQQGAIDYYRIKLSDMGATDVMFHIVNKFLDVTENRMRVILYAKLNGSDTGRIEMRPVSREEDGSFRFETEMYPLNELVDVDDRIHVASLEYGGGGWIPTSSGSVVTISATNPELQIAILIKSEIDTYPTEVNGDDSYTGYRVADRYTIDDISLVQELKEMRSVVNFGESSVPSEDEMSLYNDMISICMYNPASIENIGTFGNLWNVRSYTKDMSSGITPESPTFEEIKTLSGKMAMLINEFLDSYARTVNPSSQVSTDKVENVVDALGIIANPDSSVEYSVPSYSDPTVKQGFYNNGKFYSDPEHQHLIQGEVGFFYMDITPDPGNSNLWVAYKYNIDTDKYTQVHLICWTNVDLILASYNNEVVALFNSTNVNGGVEIQLIPFVQHTLMNSDRFKSFVSSFTQVHKALEPVIMERLEGNNYLDCKLTATYGYPHTYCKDEDVNKDGEEYFWPDLNIQIEFDVKLFNQALATNTLNELRLIVKSYFNRLTSIHTPVDLISMNNNIYISHLIQQMEAHDNVAYMKFKGWYTNEKPPKVPNGNYMDANVQAIVQKWRRLEDFPKYTRDGRLVSELEHFVPEMFVMEDDNIVINILK